MNRPSPTRIVAQLNKANDPAVTVKPAIIQRIVMENPPCPQGEFETRVVSWIFVVNNPNSNLFRWCSEQSRICFDFVRSGECKISDTLNKKCVYSHDLDLALESVHYLCNKKFNIKLPYQLVCCMANINLPLNKTLNEPLGVRIVGIVVKAIVMVRCVTAK
jgi:hypothetical protein